MKIVINNCYGGFSISKECAEFMAKEGCLHAKSELEECAKKDEKDRKKDSIGRNWYGYGYTKKFPDTYSRTNSYLIKAVEELKEKANGNCAKLKVIEIPDGVDYYIDDYDGYESIHEQHRSW
jgi:hypothetical protein